MTTGVRKSQSTDQAAQRLFNEYWGRCAGICSAHRSAQLSGVPPEAREAVQKSTASLFTTQPKGLFLVGDVGMGKTSALVVVWKLLAFAIAQAISQGEDYQKLDRIDLRLRMSHSLPVYFRTQGQLITELRDDSEDRKYGARLWSKESILLLDDFGRGHDDKSGWNVSLQFEFIDWRWKNLLPTFVTSNLTGEQLRALGSNWEASIDRMADPKWMQAVTMKGESRRKRDTR